MFFSCLLEYSYNIKISTMKNDITQGGHNSITCQKGWGTVHSQMKHLRACFAS